MRVRRLERELWVPEEIERVFAFFADARNLEELTPPFLHFEVLTPQPIEMREGALIDYRLRLHGIPVRWRTEICAWEPPFRFVDQQLRGPYRKWYHEHTFESVNGGTRMRDIVDYVVPGWVLESLVHRWFVKGDVERIFDYRTEQLARRYKLDG